MYLVKSKVAKCSKRKMILFVDVDVNDLKSSRFPNTRAQLGGNEYGADTRAINAR